MPDVQVFRNDGEALFGEDSRTLEYIDPGVVLLYADTAAGVVCSYFEGRLGQPVQGTVECTFDDEIDLSRVRPALEGVDASGLSVSSAPRENAASARWALDGLTEDQLWLADPQHDAVRRFVETEDAQAGGRSWLPSRLFPGEGWSLGDVADDLLLADADDADANGDPDDDGDSPPERDDAADGDRPVRVDGPPAPARGAGLDFETRSTYDATRFFAFLVDALADTGVTIAVSKAGRVDAIDDVDVVIRPDGDLPAGSSVEPLPDTRERLDVQRNAVARERAREHLVEPVAALGDAYRDAATDEAVDDDTGEDVLRELLDARLGAHSSLAIVDEWRARYRRVRIALVAALVGVLVGVLGGEPLRLAGWRVETTARDLAATDPGVVRAAVLDAASGAGALAVPGAAALVLAAVAVARHRSTDARERTHRPSTARSDLRRIALTAAVVAALLALASSAILIYAGT
ncbi:hypothetical protein [Halorubellus litoreus]|uniref:Uncharacterized protein n=1 Tax=Halorubellus litoreus TaxID=755308 RepID=A0ABD5VMW5_9EURY